MGRTFSLFLLSGLFLSVVSAANSTDTPQAGIVWDSSTLTLVHAGGGYGRMVRLPGGEILCSFEAGGAVYLRRSADEGRNWDTPHRVASYRFGAAANPELVVLASGSVLLTYNERPADGAHSYTIRLMRSEDGGWSWSSPTTLYQAGRTSGTGCWEPVAIQLASGEVQVYFSNEAPFPSTTEQEIDVMRSFDGGWTWSAPVRASFRRGSRDGMPTPVELQDGSGVVLAIEDNGMSGTFKPAIVAEPGQSRWSALDAPLPAAIYAGAPYLRQFPSGETVLSVQSAADRLTPGVEDHSRMVVYVGDDHGRGFTAGSEPFPVPAAASGLWNSLFIKDAATVTAISTTTLNGIQGVWAIDGHLPPPPGADVTPFGNARPGAVSPAVAEQTSRSVFLEVRAPSSPTHR